MIKNLWTITVIFMFTFSGCSSLSEKEKRNKDIMLRMIVESKQPSYISGDPAAFISSLRGSSIHNVGTIAPGERHDSNSLWKGTSGLPRNALIAEAIINPHLVMAETSTRFALIVNMESQIRLWYKGSAPVATPGYKGPEASFNFFAFDIPLNLGFSMGHFSNGQSQSSTINCSENNTDCFNGKHANHYNGNFSSPVFFSFFADFFVNLDEKSFLDDDYEYGLDSSVWISEFEIEAHPFVNGSPFEKDHSRYYPEMTLRSRNKIKLNRLSFHVDLSFFAFYDPALNVTSGPQGSTASLGVKISYHLIKSGNVDPFIGYHIGRDYYSSWMDRDLRFIQLGFITSLGTENAYSAKIEADLSSKKDEADEGKLDSNK